MRYEHLMSPIRVGRHLIKNRIIAAPVTLHSASNGEIYPDEAAMHFFVQRARAGAGIVVCAGAKVLPVVDDGEHAGWDLYRHNAMNRLAELAERIHFYGAKASMELIGIFDDGYVASNGGLLMDGLTPGREIPFPEMMRYKEGYAHAAEKLMELGFDGLFLHFGHAIPIAQFLSPLTNHRTDEYGGSFENRMRYPLEILEAIRERVGDSLFIDIRMSADEFKEGGIDLNEGNKIARAFQQYADMVQASCGMVTPDLMCRTHPCDFLPPNPNVYLAKAFKNSGSIHAHVTAIGGIGNLADADQIIAEGTADFVAMSRALIADPELIPKSLAGKELDVVPCIKCMRCHDSTVFGHYFQCSVNPTIGIMHHLGHMIPPVNELKRVAVVGGGPAGMFAALTASERGHNVTLFEKTDNLGGALKFATSVDFKYSLAGFRDYLVQQIRQSKVNVITGREISPEEIKKAGYEAVVVAVGAEPLVPSIPGIDSAIHAIHSYGKEDHLGETVVVIGGGQVGCETGLHLARMGKQVTIVEMRDEMAPDASKSHRDDIMTQMEQESRLTLFTNTQCKAVSIEGVVCKLPQGEQKIAADNVILAAGMKARTELADSFWKTAPICQIIGDSSKPRTVEMAIREGYFAGINL
ncbi:FAD-dependent oxidoreductase [Anoxynatronum buryatiense]|uniref:2,4-dienoyl-CoA reductase n=1 Tax=Anoxynatronum buryatiense TaxID=489973 RepID=A0AA45WTH1_9CLOT|nr:FAD-dependent oxidoreductase [Anoxynatronum buryatiense]SMP42962.1 2,4-dienoyl-CoA reductase [Anoxynatronum buryatiense]